MERIPFMGALKLMQSTQTLKIARIRAQNTNKGKGSLGFIEVKFALSFIKVEVMRVRLTIYLCQG